MIPCFKTIPWLSETCIKIVGVFLYHMEIKPVSILWFALDNANVFHSNSVYTYFKSDYFVFYTSSLLFYIEQQQ